ncbi:MAG: NUDIX domain-containing protein [Cyclobacteriaceae bacterium]|jgi:8-oxo-dGTP diphosphatase|nr:NUDIX domain-containing protein [Cyclobacteriaceae bacterium]
MENVVNSLYGNRTRIRVCGLCWEGDKLLMIQHEMAPGRYFWAPPGGGVEFGQQLEDALLREFHEETRLAITVGQFRFIAELIKPPLHALEVFFDVKTEGKNPETGTDPEMPAHAQIIKSTGFMEWSEIQRLPAGEKHGLFTLCPTPESLRSLSGHHKI